MDSCGLSRRLRGNGGGRGAAGVAVVVVAAVEAKAVKATTEEAEETAHGEYLQNGITEVTVAAPTIKVNM